MLYGVTDICCSHSTCWIMLLFFSIFWAGPRAQK